jgi:predicted AAA+ superfamily ATPase
MEATMNASKIQPEMILYSNSLMGKYVLVRGYELSLQTPKTMEYLYDHTLPSYDYIEKNNRKKIKIICLSHGIHIVEYNDITFKIAVENPNPNSVTMEPYPANNIVYRIIVSVMGFPSPKEAQAHLIEFVDHCKKSVEEQMENYCKEAGKTIKKFIFDPAEGGNWTILNVANKRPIDSIFLPKEDKQMLMDTVKDFSLETAAADYARFNVPYKLNILLHGLAGTGKTSCIHAIASELNTDIGIIHFGLKVDDTMLTKAINQMSNLENCRILVFEDIDSLFSDERKAHDSSRNAITLSGLLNCLDGLSRNEGLIIFMTTNRRDILADVALSRSCRVDIELEFKDAIEDQIEQMLRYYFPTHIEKANREALEKAKEILMAKKYTTATLQKYFFSQRHCENILELPKFQTFSKKETTMKGGGEPKSVPGLYL